LLSQTPRGTLKPLAGRAAGMFKEYCIYILASRIGGTLYIGVTNDLIRRVSEHKKKLVPGFTKKYDVSRLVYFEGP
jgi:predicted GIY-YIG superfamily endonuclease